jgi:hypothetical protein
MEAERLRKFAPLDEGEGGQGKRLLWFIKRVFFIYLRGEEGTWKRRASENWPGKNSRRMRREIELLIITEGFPATIMVCFVSGSA